MRRNYKYNIGDIVKSKTGNHKIIDKTIEKDGTSSYICICNNDHQYIKRQTKINTGCPYCSNRIIEHGINDISTTNNEMFSMLVDKSFGYNHCETSQEKTLFNCPICNNTVFTTPYLVKTRGLKCPKCSDGFSYGEKFIMNLLTVIDIPYIYQYSSKNQLWCGKYKYDFYIPSKDCIIEVNGLQHYKDCTWSNYEEVHKNDTLKKSLAKDYVRYYINLDVRESNLIYIKQSILRSNLDDILELYLYDDIISWKQIHEKSLSPIIIKIIEKYNSITKDVSTLSNLLNVSSPTIVKYLKEASFLKLCDYNPKEVYNSTLKFNHSNNSNRCSKPIICLEDDRVYKNAKILEENSKSIYGEFIDKRNISAVCNKKQKTTKGHIFKFITKKEFNKIKDESPELACGEKFNVNIKEE